MNVIRLRHPPVPIVLLFRPFKPLAEVLAGDHVTPEVIPDLAMRYLRPLLVDRGWFLRRVEALEHQPVRVIRWVGYLNRLLNPGQIAPDAHPHPVQVITDVSPGRVL